MSNLPFVDDILQDRGRQSAMAGRRMGRCRNSRIYLDHGSTTPCDSSVAAFMAQVTEFEFANPSSAHKSGQQASKIVENAREAVASSICALPEEIVFTSGATESNNMAIIGVAAEAEQAGERRRQIVTIGIEHSSVLEPLHHLEKRGFEINIVPVCRDGVIDLDVLTSTLSDRTLLLSIQAANNEIGTIQPLADATKIARDCGALVHCDAAQAFGKIPFDVEAAHLDFASLSAHKCYGPKGVGALWINGGPSRSPIAPIQFGGGQEQYLRPGTHNTVAIAGFGRATQIAAERLETDATWTAILRDRFEELMHQLTNGIVINGAKDRRLPGATSITFKGVDADAIIARSPGLDLSAASACQSRTQSPSHVLRSIGLSEQQAYSTLRAFFGRSSTLTGVKHAAHEIADAVASIRRDQS